MKPTKRICDAGHTYYKSSDCPTCPICEAEKRPNEGMMAKLSAPARRALVNAGIHSVEELAKWTEKDLLALHGLGPSSIPKLKQSLSEKGLQFQS